MFHLSILARWTDRQAGRITPEHLAAGAKAGDRFALSILDQVTFPLAQALNVLVGSVGIEKIVLVGGFALGLGSFGSTAVEVRDLVTLGIPDDYSGLIGAGILVQAEARR